MDMKTLAVQARMVCEAGERFLEQYETTLTEFLKQKDLTAEEYLQREILVELTDHLYRIRHITAYLEKTNYRTGVLNRNHVGKIVFNGEVLPLMTELEVYVQDEILGREVWTRTFVGGIDKNYLVGLKKDHKIKNIPARIRE